MEASLQDILAAREARVRRQEALLQERGGVLLCLTMNIAGPVKNSPLIRAGFHMGHALLQGAFSPRYSMSQEEATGCEGYYVLQGNPMEIKRQAVLLEDSTPAGRLFDMDVLTTDGKIGREQVGLPPRKCLLCDGDARICGRSRAHSVQALQAETTRLLRQAVSAHIGALAAESLRSEVYTTPKPGLVDQNNCGSHRDMDIALFVASANALESYFASCARIGMETADRSPGETFFMLRTEGLAAEQTMYRVTGGVNTHKGAIFTLGLLCGAAGRTLSRQPEVLLLEVKAMTAGLTTRDLTGVTAENAITAGQRLFAQHGITGVRGQAEQGFPAVLQVGLPVLEQGLQQGLSLNDAGCAALLHILTATDDTNMANRSDVTTAKAVAAKLGALLAQNPYPSQETLLALDRAFIERNLSPGGSADLLAAVYFLYMFKEDRCELQSQLCASDPG